MIIKSLIYSKSLVDENMTIIFSYYSLLDSVCNEHSAQDRYLK